MRRKAYGFKVAGQTNQGSARLAILGQDYVKVKRAVNRDVDYLKGKIAKAEMTAALAAFSEEELSAFSTKGEYNPPKVTFKKANALPMNFYRGTGYGG
jgi:hypothetical protein